MGQLESKLGASVSVSVPELAVNINVPRRPLSQAQLEAQLEMQTDAQKLQDEKIRQIRAEMEETRRQIAARRRLAEQAAVAASLQGSLRGTLVQEEQGQQQQQNQARREHMHTTHTSPAAAAAMQSSVSVSALVRSPGSAAVAGAVIGGALDAPVLRTASPMLNALENMTEEQMYAALNIPRW